MGTTADKLQAVVTSKEEIRLAIAGKGVSIPEETTLAEYPAKITAIPTGGGGSTWTAPADWIQLEEPADNEILMLTCDLNTEFDFTVTCVGGYTVNWGDGFVENIASGATARHDYASGTGTPCSRGYTTFKVRVYAQNPSNPITRIVPAWRLTYLSSGLLWARLGTTGLTSLASAFFSYSIQYDFLEKVSLPNELPNCTSFSNAFTNADSLQAVDMPSVYSSSPISFYETFSNCIALSSIDYRVAELAVSSFNSVHNQNKALVSAKLPDIVNGCSSFNSAFAGTQSLGSLKLPVINTNTIAAQMVNNSRVLRLEFDSSWDGRITEMSSFASNVLEIINMPSSIAVAGTGSAIFAGQKFMAAVRVPDPLVGTFTAPTGMFSSCSHLKTISNFPALPDATSINQTFYNCFNLKYVDNLDQLGNTTSNMDLSGTYQSCYNLETIVCRNKVTSAFNCFGSSTIPAKLSSLLFTNPNPVSTWAAGNMVNVQYCNMDATALNAMFTSIVATSAPGALSGKTVRVFGNPGAATCDTSIITSQGGFVTI